MRTPSSGTEWPGKKQLISNGRLTEHEDNPRTRRIGECKTWRRLMESRIRSTASITLSSVKRFENPSSSSLKPDCGVIDELDRATSFNLISLRHCFLGDSTRSCYQSRDAIFSTFCMEHEGHRFAIFLRYLESRRPLSSFETTPPQ